MIGMLPIRAQSALGDLLGSALRASGFRARVIGENLMFAFPGTGDDEMTKREALRRAAYSHLGRLVLEILILLGPMRRRVRVHSELRGKSNWDAAHARGKGVLFLSSHVGNWEIMAGAGALGGIDLMLVTKHLKPEWLHRAIEKGRLRCGVRATYEPRTMRDILAELKRGGTVGFVLDQYAGAPVGVRVPVFGVPVGTSTALATLARRTGAAVVPVVNYRTPDGRLVVEIEPALDWLPDDDPARELARNTAHYAARLEQHIRSHPEQWLWTHRRFKGDLSPLRTNEWSEGRARS